MGLNLCPWCQTDLQLLAARDEAIFEDYVNIEDLGKLGIAAGAMLYMLLVAYLSAYELPLVTDSCDSDHAGDIKKCRDGKPYLLVSQFNDRSMHIHPLDISFSSGFPHSQGTVHVHKEGELVR